MSRPLHIVLCARFYLPKKDQTVRLGRRPCCGDSNRCARRSLPFWVATLVLVAHAGMASESPIAPADMTPTGEHSSLRKTPADALQLLPRDRYCCLVNGSADPSVSGASPFGRSGAPQLLPRARYYFQEERHTDPSDAGKQTRAPSSTVDILARKVAAGLESYRPWQAGVVTKVTRKGFWINLGEADGIERGLSAEIMRARTGGLPQSAIDALSDAGVDTLRKLISGPTVPVTHARVRSVDSESSLLRSTDPTKGRRVKRGDLVRIYGAQPRVLVGSIAGTAPQAVREALRYRLVEEIEKRGTPSAVAGPSVGAGSDWVQGQMIALCTAGLEAGCSYAAAATAYFSGDSLHVMLGVVDANLCETVRIISASAAVDPALAALVTQGAPGGVSQPAPSPPQSRAGLGICVPYETGLRPSLKTELHRPALAVYVLSDARALCVAHQDALEIYAIDPESPKLVMTGRYDIEASAPRRPCRDPAGRMAAMDSDGDGREELVLWASIFESPVAFSFTVDSKARELVLDPADTYWLPWSGTLADVRYVEGANFMTMDGALLEHHFYDWREADLDGDGHEEVIYTGTGGALIVEEAAGRRSERLGDVGSSLEVYDMDLDGLPEIIVSSRRLPGEGDALKFYNYSAQGGEELWRVEDLPGDIISLAAGLLDSDDLPDLVALIRPGLRAEESSVIVMLTAHGPAREGSQSGNRLKH